MNRGQHGPYPKDILRSSRATRMTGDGLQGPPAKLTRAKKRIVTSCLECYRRKQKVSEGIVCDVLRPLRSLTIER